MSESSGINSESGEVLIEIRGIYDGWSVRKLADGTLVNRWDASDRRHKPTQEWIERVRADQDGRGGNG